MGWPAKAGSPGYPLSRGKCCHVNVSRWCNPPSRGRSRDTSILRKNHFGGGFASLLKVTIESHSPEGCSKSSKWVLKSINRQNTWFSSIFLVYVLSDHSIILRKCNPGWRGCKIACKGGLCFYPTWAGYLNYLGSPPPSRQALSIGNSMISSDMWHTYHEWYFEIVIRNFTSR